MIRARLTILGLAGMLFVWGVESAAWADIYHFKDENGVWHFSNIKSDRRYKLYLRNSTTRIQSASSYIKEFNGIIKQAAERYAVEESLIKAVIKAESDFDHRAISCKGAQGLMQLMPDTADALRVYDPFDPVSNIFGGTCYLSFLLERFNKNKELAVAAYNAGPEKVEEYQGIPPFSETIAFVKRVMSYYRQFLSSN
jgi:soluble lytic murein transglycosylase-like protein